MLGSGAADTAVPFRYNRPTGRDEVLLAMAHTYLISAVGDPPTSEPTVDFARIQDRRLVLPRRPSHWRDALDEAARSLGFNLTPVAEADSLMVQKSLVMHEPNLYSILGPFAIAAEIASGSLQASGWSSPTSFAM